MDKALAPPRCHAHCAVGGTGRRSSQPVKGGFVMSSPIGAFPHLSSPVYQAACQALLPLERVAHSLSPAWRRLAPEQRAAGLSVVQCLARAFTCTGAAQRALLRQAFAQAAEAESLLSAAGLLGAAPAELVAPAVAAYMALGQSSRPRGSRRP